MNGSDRGTAYVLSAPALALFALLVLLPETVSALRST